MNLDRPSITLDELERARREEAESRNRAPMARAGGAMALAAMHIGQNMMDDAMAIGNVATRPTSVDLDVIAKIKKATKNPPMPSGLRPHKYQPNQGPLTDAEVKARDQQRRAAMKGMRQKLRNRNRRLQ